MREFFSGIFTPDPGVLDGIFALAVLYGLAVGPGRRFLAPEEKFERRRAVAFAIAIAILATT